MTRQIVTLPISLIDVGDRLRELDPDWAALLAETMKDRGLDTPIRVSEADTAGRHRLIAGLHRLEAAKLAGWAKIDAILFSGTALEAELLEIDENLIRRELSELDRATFLARRKAVWEELHPETRHGGDRRSDQVAKLGNSAEAALQQRFSAATAKKLGLSERVIQRAVARYAAIDPAVRKMLATSRIAEKGTELDALAKFERQQQLSIADELLDPENSARSVREAAIRLGLVDDTPVSERDRQYQALLATWGKSSNVRARQDFVDYLVASATPALRKRLQAALAREEAPAGDDA